MFDEYEPWIQKGDFGSKGNITTLDGIVVPRVHHLLSDLELIYFMALERQPDVVDIREQWPILDLESTLEICTELGVAHGYDGRMLRPFTVDFLITRSKGGELILRGESIKSVADAAKPNVRHRLKVEDRWLKSKSVPWVLVRTNVFTMQLHDNLRFLRTWFVNRYQPDEYAVAEFVRYFLQAYVADDRLDEQLHRAEKALYVDFGVAENMFRYAAWKFLIPVSLHTKLDLDRPVTILSSK